jgi:hypothetical protein
MRSHSRCDLHHIESDTRYPGGLLPAGYSSLHHTLCGFDSIFCWSLKSVVPLVWPFRASISILECRRPMGCRALSDPAMLCRSIQALQRYSYSRIFLSVKKQFSKMDCLTTLDFSKGGFRDLQYGILGTWSSCRYQATQIFPLCWICLRSHVLFGILQKVLTTDRDR